VLGGGADLGAEFVDTERRIGCIPDGAAAATGAIGAMGMGAGATGRPDAVGIPGAGAGEIILIMGVTGAAVA